MTIPRPLRAALLVFTGLLATAPAQEPRQRRLGVFLWHDSPNDLATLAGIRTAIERSGLPHTFVERRAGSDRDRATVALRELQEARCDLVFALGTQGALLAKDTFLDVPIVFAAVSDAVASGLVPDWSGSGINMCGASNWIPPANVIDVFRLAVPHCERLGVIRTKTSGVVSTAEVAQMKAFLATPGAPRIELHEAVAPDAAGIGGAVRRLLDDRVDAIWIPIDITLYQNVAAIQSALGAAKVPLVTTAAAAVRNGAHVGAAVDYELHGRRAGALALEVLVRGKSPATLPVDRMRGVVVSVNLASARASGIDLPLSLLAVADDLMATAAEPDAGANDGRRRR